MYGSATLAIVVSSACIKVARMTQTVMAVVLMGVSVFIVRLRVSRRLFAPPLPGWERHGGRGARCQRRAPRSAHPARCRSPPSRLRGEGRKSEPVRQASRMAGIDRGLHAHAGAQRRKI